MLQLSMSYNCSLQPLQCIDQGGNVYKCNFDTSSEYTCGSNYGTVVFHNSDFTKYCQYSLYSHKPDPRSPWDLQLQLDKTLNMNCDNPTTTRDQYRINY